jgi:hypothetical protein
MSLDGANEPDEKTLALLMVIAEMLEFKSGADGLSTKYERAIDNIRWKKSGAPQTPAEDSPRY